MHQVGHWLRFLIFDTSHLDTIFISEGCEDLWLFFVAKEDREQTCLVNSDVDSFLTGRSYELGNIIRENLVSRFRFFYLYGQTDEFTNGQAYVN